MRNIQQTYIYSEIFDEVLSIKKKEVELWPCVTGAADVGRSLLQTRTDTLTSASKNVGGVRLLLAES